MIDYKMVVDKLQSVIPNVGDSKFKFWTIELSESYIEGESVVVIYLLDMGSNNKYRLYHSELNDYTFTDKELLQCCLDELAEIYGEIKLNMSSIIGSAYIMLNEMDNIAE